MRLRGLGIALLVTVLASSVAIAQANPNASSEAVKAGQSSLLTTAETAKILPASVFFRGQSAPLQIRNSGGIRFQDHSLMLISLVDTSGYSSQVQEKYQAYLITESALDIDGHRLVPGAYGCGFINGGFIVMDLGAHDLFTARSSDDAGLRRPKPLQVLTDPNKQDNYRIYAGRSYVTFRVVASD